MRVIRNIAAAALLALPFAAAADEAMRTVSVDGVGRVEAVPDIAIVQFGVRRDAREAGAAMTSASEAMTEVLASVAEAGIAPEDVQTTRVGLEPSWRHSDDGSPPRIVGYIASNDLSVTVRDMELLGALLDAVVADGANTMNGLRFEVSNREELEQAARAEAVEDARQKALTLAETAGAGLGPVVSLSEGGGGGGPMPMFEAADAMRSAVPVARGELEVVVALRAVFELAD